MTMKEKKEQLRKNVDREIEFNKANYNGNRVVLEERLYKLSEAILEKLGDKVEGVMAGQTQVINDNLTITEKIRRLDTRIILTEHEANTLTADEMDERFLSVADDVVEEFLSELSRYDEKTKLWMYFPVLSAGLLIDPETKNFVFGLMTRFAAYIED